MSKNEDRGVVKFGPNKLDNARRLRTEIGDGSETVVATTGITGTGITGPYSFLVNGTVQDTDASGGTVLCEAPVSDAVYCVNKSGQPIGVDYQVAVLVTVDGGTRTYAIISVYGRSGNNIIPPFGATGWPRTTGTYEGLHLDFNNQGFVGILTADGGRGLFFRYSSFVGSFNNTNTSSIMWTNFEDGAVSYGTLGSGEGKLFMYNGSAAWGTYNNIRCWDYMNQTVVTLPDAPYGDIGTSIDGHLVSGNSTINSTNKTMTLTVSIFVPTTDAYTGSWETWMTSSPLPLASAGGIGSVQSNVISADGWFYSAFFNGSIIGSGYWKLDGVTAPGSVPIFPFIGGGVSQLPNVNTSPWYFRIRTNSSTGTFKVEGSSVTGATSNTVTAVPYSTSGGVAGYYTYPVQQITMIYGDSIIVVGWVEYRYAGWTETDRTIRYDLIMFRTDGAVLPVTSTPDYVYSSTTPFRVPLVSTLGVGTSIGGTTASPNENLIVTYLKNTPAALTAAKASASSISGDHYDTMIW